MPKSLEPLNLGHRLSHVCDMSLSVAVPLVARSYVALSAAIATAVVAGTAMGCLNECHWVESMSLRRG